MDTVKDSVNDQDNGKVHHLIADFALYSVYDILNEECSGLKHDIGTCNCVKTGKTLAQNQKQLFRTEISGKCLWSLHISDKSENGIVDILLIPALREGVDDLSDIAPAKEVVANMFLSIKAVIPSKRYLLLSKISAMLLMEYTSRICIVLSLLLF